MSVWRQRPVRRRRRVGQFAGARLVLLAVGDARERGGHRRGSAALGQRRPDGGVLLRRRAGDQARARRRRAERAGGPRRFRRSRPRPGRSCRRRVRAARRRRRAASGWGDPDGDGHRVRGRRAGGARRPRVGRRQVARAGDRGRRRHHRHRRDRGRSTPTTSTSAGSPPRWAWWRGRHPARGRRHARGRLRSGGRGAVGRDARIGCARDGRGRRARPADAGGPGRRAPGPRATRAPDPPVDGVRRGSALRAGERRRLSGRRRAVRRVVEPRDLGS